MRIYLKDEGRSEKEEGFWILGLESILDRIYRINRKEDCAEGTVASCW